MLPYCQSPERKKFVCRSPACLSDCCLGYVLCSPAAEDGEEQTGEPDADDPSRPGRVRRKPIGRPFILYYYFTEGYF